MSNEEAILVLQNDAYVLYEDDSPYDRQAYDMAIKALKEQKHGQWIRSVDELGEAWMCSECLSEFFPTDGDMDDFIDYVNYCPNCGARMEGDSDV